MDICLLSATHASTLDAGFLVSFLVLAVSIPVLIAVFVVREHRGRKQREEEREKERSAAEIAQLKAALAATQAEAERIGRNLHDGVTSHLSVIRGEIGLFIESPEYFEFTRLREIHEHMGNVLTDARNQSHRYTGYTLAHHGLREAIKKEVHDVCCATNGIAVELTIHDFEDSHLSTLQAENLYCIVMEGIANALKHADATRITIHLGTHANEVRLEITDDGCGFTPEAARGLGLTNISHRTLVCEGSYHLDSQPGQGTTLLIKLPKHG